MRLMDDVPHVTSVEKWQINIDILYVFIIKWLFFVKFTLNMKTTYSK